MVDLPTEKDPGGTPRQLRVRSRKTKQHKKKKRGRPASANRVWIVPEHNEEPDARKLSRAFLALALHRAANEADAEHVHRTQLGSGDHDEPS